MSFAEVLRVTNAFVLGLSDLVNGTKVKERVKVTKIARFIFLRRYLFEISKFIVTSFLAPEFVHMEYDPKKIFYSLS